MRAGIDHLVYATPDLLKTVDDLQTRLGIVLVPGGPHSGRGTRNWLAGLGNHSYLEVIGPDIDQPAPRFPRPFGIDDLEASRLVTWCVRPNRPLSEIVREVVDAGGDLGDILAMSRMRPDGVLLKWNLTVASPMTNDGIVPFCIDWLESEHPSISLNTTTPLTTLRLSHPDPKQIRSILAVLGVRQRAGVGVGVQLEEGEPAIVAIVKSPNGMQVL